MGQLYLYMGGIRLNSNIRCVFSVSGMKSRINGSCRVLGRC